MRDVCTPTRSGFNGLVSSSPLGGTSTVARRSWARFLAPTLVLAIAGALAVSLWLGSDDNGPAAGEGRSDNGAVRVSAARMPAPFDPARASIYMTITNDASVDDALIGARADGSAFVAVHRTEIDSAGTATMSPSPEVAVPAGGEAVLEPGGTHLMLDVPADLAAGDTYPVTMLLASGNDVTVDVDVVDPSDVIR